MKVSEVNAKRDAELEKVFQDQVDTLRKEKRARENLEKRIQDATQLRKSLEQ